MTNIVDNKRRRWTAITFIVVVQIFVLYTSKIAVVNAFVTKTTSTSTLLHPKSSSRSSSSSSSSSVAGLTSLPSLPQSYTSTTGGTYTKATTARQQSKRSMILQHKQHTHQLHQQRRRLGLGLFSTAVAAADAETELPLPAAAIEEEHSHDNDRKKKKIERMIDKIEWKYLSSSRLLRILFYPLVSSKVALCLFHQQKKVPAVATIIILYCVIVKKTSLYM